LIRGSDAEGKVISEDLGIKLENVMLEEPGNARKVTIDKETTTIIDGGGDPKDLQVRRVCLLLPVVIVNALIPAIGSCKD